MTRVDFYILPEGAGSDAVATACKLCDKATAAGNRLYVLAPDAALASALDRALWTQREGSFIAHERAGAQPPEPPLPAVLIGTTAEPPEGYHDVLINLALEIPPCFSRFERVLEIVDGEPLARARSRERYKFYRDRGYELATHNL